MQRKPFKFKSAVRWYTLAIIALIVVFFLVGLITNKWNKSTEDSQTSETVLFDNILIETKLLQKGISVNGTLLSDKVSDLWGELIITEQDSFVQEINFTLMVYPTASDSDSTIIEELNTRNAEAITRIKNVYTAIRDAMIAAGEITDASAKRIDTIMVQIDRIIKDTGEYSWTWGRYTFNISSFLEGDYYYLSTTANIKQ
ncbi:MAG: hypothetical protein PHT58_04850 [Eubacteriales bacterium]|nr:hypothetical protein [Eubacteriales bacterium]